MKNCWKNIMLVAACIPIVYLSFGQLPAMKTQLEIKRKPTAPIFFLHPASVLGQHKIQSQQTSPFGSYVHYPAFFCSMEQKSINRLGVCIQVHAGNYNSYMKK